MLRQKACQLPPVGIQSADLDLDYGEAGAMKLAVCTVVGTLATGAILSMATPFVANASTPARVDPPYGSCKEAHADGAYNIKKGDPGYRPKLDRDNDGVACEG